MTFNEEHLSAFLDGELTPEESQAVEAALAEDPALQAQLEALMAADTVAQEEFSAMAADPAPLHLLASIEQADIVASVPEPANEPTPPRRAAGLMVASAVVLALGLGGFSGFFLGQQGPAEVASARTWLTDIADYHAVYANQVRHLVEVPAEEAEHIQTWLTATLGADVTVPDLADQGLTFEGARLLVAVGRPVAQLIYTDAEGGVVALCQIATPTPAEAFAEQNIEAFDLVTWGGEGANFVIIGDEGREDLRQIAEAAALQV